MQSSNSVFRYWENPRADAFGRSVIEFLNTLGGPAHIHIHGHNRSRCRVMVTLLHGNEPSGVTALFHLIQKGITPAIDLHCFIPNVETALADPLFYHRSLPGVRDLNRCFNGPFDDEPGIIARALLDQIAALHPEAIIDIHNTSGSGPSFGVTTFMDSSHDALVSLFSLHVIVTNLKLGALMEHSGSLCPTVTIECGGADDSESSRLAEEGLLQYFIRNDVLSPADADFSLDFYHNPLRLELRDKRSGRLFFGDKANPEGGLTLRPDIEHFNFAEITPEDRLGYVNNKDMSELTAKTTTGEEKLHEYFDSIDGEFRAKTRLRLFMITTRTEIARSDCLFYLAPGQ